MSKEKKQYPIVYIECDCHSEMLQLSFDNDEDMVTPTGEDLRFLSISFYKYGHVGSYYSWRERLRHIRHIIKEGHPYSDNIILRKSERLKLTEYLNSLPQ